MDMYDIVAIGELLVGFLTHNIWVAVLGLVVYFFALYVIHVLRTHGGSKK